MWQITDIDRQLSSGQTGDVITDKGKDGKQSQTNQVGDNNAPPQDERIKWEDILDIVGKGELKRFYRRPQVLKEYKEHLARVEKDYGTTQSYILKQVLPWTGYEELINGPEKVARDPSAAIAMENCPHGQKSDNDAEVSKCQDAPFFQGSEEDVSVQETPFPYAVPEDVTHYIVWSKRVLLHPCAIDPNAPQDAREKAWRWIQQYGLTGFLPKSLARYARRAKSTHVNGREGNNKSESATTTTTTTKPHHRRQNSAEFDQLVQSAGRYIQGFVESKWGPDHEAVWFANPPSLQSLPLLPHWHCMVRKRREEDH